MTTALAQPPDTRPKQLDEMKKLQFLVGNWKGQGWMMMGPGRRSEFVQTEMVVSKLDGLVIQIDGLGKKSLGEVVHSALGVVRYDPASNSFRFHAFDGLGHYLDADAAVRDGALVWFLPAGPRKIRYTIRLNDKGQWLEIGESSADETNWTKFFEMTLDRVKP